MSLPSLDESNAGLQELLSCHLLILQRRWEHRAGIELAIIAMMNGIILWIPPCYLMNCHGQRKSESSWLTSSKTVAPWLKLGTSYIVQRPLVPISGRKSMIIIQKAHGQLMSKCHLSACIIQSRQIWQQDIKKETIYYITRKNTTSYYEPAAQRRHPCIYLKGRRLESKTDSKHLTGSQDLSCDDRKKLSRSRDAETTPYRDEQIAAADYKHPS